MLPTKSNEQNKNNNTTNPKPNENPQNIPFNQIPGMASLNQLFRWSIEHSDPKKLAEMKEQNYQPSKLNKVWLDAILAGETNLRIVDPVKEMKKALEVLKPNAKDEKTGKEEPYTLDEKLEAVEAIHSFVEQIDAANDFYKIGGLVIFLYHLKDPNCPVELATSMAWVLGSASQNNKEFQGMMLQMQGLKPLLSILSEKKSDDEKKQEMLQSKILFALSSLLTNNSQACKKFLSEGGIHRVVQCLKNSTDLGTKIKSVFLLFSLFIDDQTVVDEVVDKLHNEPSSSDIIVATLKEGMEKDNLDLIEKTLMLIIEITTRVKKLQKEVCASLVNAGLKEVLKALSEKTKNDKDDVYYEVKELMEKIKL